MLAARGVFIAICMLARSTDNDEVIALKSFEYTEQVDEADEVVAGEVGVTVVEGIGVVAGIEVVTVIGGTVVAAVKEGVGVVNAAGKVKEERKNAEKNRTDRQDAMMSESRRTLKVKNNLFASVLP